MALGGGTFQSQNKVLPGAYINFISMQRASASLSDRGYVAMPLELDWGPDTVFEVTAEEFQKKSMSIFGYDYISDKLKGLRDLFLNVKVLYAYRLNGSGVKASNTYATARYAGTRGNDLKIVITKNVDEQSKFDVTLYLGTMRVEKQTITLAVELVDNEYVIYKKDATLVVTAGTMLAGGTNSTVDAAAHQDFLNKIESYSFNTLGLLSKEDTIKQLYINFTKRLRDEVGAKFQLVLYDKTADFEGVINIKNKCLDGVTVTTGATTYPNETSLVYWVTGIEAGCAVNQSCTNRKYDGEFVVDTNYTQADLIASVKVGELIFHNENNEARVLTDINSLVSLSDEKGAIFQDNQTVRVIDQVANDDATLFKTKYVGKVPNDASGRISFWNDVVAIRKELLKLRAIENFADKDVEVSKGEGKKSVVITDKLQIVNTMEKLYMTTTIE